MAVELLKLTEDHGRDAWVSHLNKKPYSIAGVSWLCDGFFCLHHLASFFCCRLLRNQCEAYACITCLHHRHPPASKHPQHLANTFKQPTTITATLSGHTQVTKQSLPSSGTLVVTFVAKHKLSWEAQALPDPFFHSLWTQHVQPRATPSRPSLLLQQTSDRGFLNPGASWTDPGFSWPGNGAHDGLGQQAAAGFNDGGGSSSSWGGNGMRVHAVSDGWKLELLRVGVV